MYPPTVPEDQFSNPFENVEDDEGETSNPFNVLDSQSEPLEALENAPPESLIDSASNPFSEESNASVPNNNNQLLGSWTELQISQIESQTAAKIPNPLTREQLNASFNPLGIQAFAELLDQFLLSKGTTHDCELWSLVQEHYNSRIAYVKTWKKLQELKSTVSGFTKSFWIFSTKVLTNSQACRDNRTVTLTHEYEYADFSESTFKMFQNLWDSMKKTLTVHLSRVQFENELSWVKIEKFLNKFLVNFVAIEKPDLNTRNATFRFSPHNSRAVSEMHKILNVLFHFLRKPKSDDKFVNDIIQWIHKCCAVFLRCSTLSDHIMLLNNALRLPASVCNDDVFTLIHLPTFNSTPNSVSEATVVALDHTLLIAKFMLSSVPQRSAYLKELEKTPDVGMNADNDGKCNWILLDDSGEESECPEASWHLFEESNVLGFIERLPLEKILSSLSSIMSNRQIFMQSIAYFNHLLTPFGDCFQHYSLERYASLRKRVASYCVALVNFTINSYIIHFKEIECVKFVSDENEILQQEVEALLMRTFSLLCQNINDKNVFPSIQNFNFAFARANTAWKLAYMLIGPQQCVEIEDLLQYDRDPKDLFLDGLNSFGSLDEKLQNSFFVCGAALLSTLSKIIGDCSFVDQELLVFTMNALFYISYISGQHKENYFKFGHNLISYLLTTHVELVTFYLNKINRNWEKMLSDISMNFLLEISLDQWIPSLSDVELLLHWLEFYDIQHSLNVLARKVLSYIDWLITDESGKLLIPTLIQNRVLEIILHIYSSTVVKSEINDVPLDAKHARSPESPPAVTSNPIQNFAAWAWKMVTIMQVKGNVLEMKGTELKAESKVVPNGHFLAMYAALVSSDSSSHMYSLSNGGLKMLKQLTLSGFLKPVVHILDAKLKFEISNLDVLFVQKSCFAEILVNICQGDSSFSHKMGLVAEAGPNTSLLSAMIVSLLQSVESINKQHSKYLMEFLLSVILSYPGFSFNYYLLHILEQLCFFSFTSKCLRECVRITFLRHLEEIQRVDVSKGFRLFSSHKYFTPLPCYKTYPEFGFVSYFSLIAQINFEDQNGIWNPLIEKMLENVQNAPGAILKDLQLEKWSCTFSETSLSIYLVVDVLMLVESNHVAFPLLSQLFFSRYFFRPGATIGSSGVNSSNSVGERFFASYYYMGTIKKLKLRFEDAAKVRRDLKTELKMSDENSEEEVDASDVDLGELYSGSSSYDVKNMTGKEAICRHLEAFSLWADEPRLHTTTVKFENLPENYIPQSLIDVITCGIKPLDIFTAEIQTEGIVIKCMKLWHDELYSYLKKPVVMVENFDFSTEAAKYRIERAKSKFVYRHFELPEVKASVIPLSSVDSQLLISNRSLLEYFGKSFNSLTSFAQKQVSVWKELSNDFDKFTELTPQQYENKVTTLQKVLNCESMLQRHRCSGPVVFDLSYNCKSENLAVSFELDRIWKKILESVTDDIKCPLEVVNAVEIMEEIVNRLIDLSQAHASSPTDKQVATNNSIDLFFLIANILSEEVLTYPPFGKITEILFNLLGSNFIANSGDSQVQLLDVLLTKPFLVQSLNAYFRPELAHGKFCAFYQKLSARIIANFDKAHAELLLTKFDFASWLSQTSNASLRSTVLGCVFDLLQFVGKEVTEEFNWTYTCASGHALMFLDDNFVLEFPTFLLGILKMSLAGRASPQLWEDFETFCGMEKLVVSTNDPEKTKSEFSNCEKLQSFVQLFSSSHFTTNISDFLHQSRVNNWEIPLIKLFDFYIEDISKFMILLAEIVIQSVNFQFARNQISSSELSLNIWNQLTALFSPLIAPLTLDDKFQLPKPNNSDPNEDNERTDSNFDVACTAFTVAILEAMSQESSLVEFDISVPSYMHHFLMYFNHVLCPASKSNNVMNHYFKTFLNLPWKSFIPNIQSVDVLLLIRQQPNINPKEFAVQIFLSIDWAKYCDLHVKMDPEVASTALHRFLLLSVLLETDDAFSENTCALIVGKLDKVRDVNWQHLSPEYLTIVLSLFFKFYYKQNSLSLRNPFGVFKLLIEASGFTTISPTDDFETVNRESSYDHKLTFMDILTSRVIKVTTVEHLSEVIESLFTFISTGLDPTSTSASAILHLMKPIVKLINSVPYDQQTTKTLEGFRRWAFDLENHDFLAFTMVVFCQDMANIETMAHFLECACEAYFKPTQGVVRSWETIANSMELPYSGRAEFVATCSKKCFYFVLEVYLRSQHLSEEEVLNLIYTWLNDSKALTAESEVKAFLLFSRCLEKLGKVMFSSNAIKFVELSRNFMTYLNELSEDRESGGIRGMIGLGAASKLSQTFRVCCKAIACFLQLQIESLMPSSGNNLNDTSGDKSPKKGQSSQVMLKSLKQYAVIKDHPHIAAKLQVMINSNLTEGVAMDSWKELMFNMVSSFYSEEYGIKVLTS